MKLTKILSVLLALSTLLCLASCLGPAEKTFTKDGLTVTLTDAFKETSVEGYTVAYDSSNVAVLAIKETFDLFENGADTTLEDYGAFVMDANSDRVAEQAKTKDGVYYFEYTFKNTDNNITYRYIVAMYKGSDAFWTVSFACDDTKYEANAEDIFAYAKSVKVN